MQVDFNPVPFAYKLTARGDPLDLNSMVGASDGFGPGIAKVEAEGVGSDTKDVKASGNVLLAAGEFPAAEMFTGVDKALGKTVLVGAPYQATEVRFRLENNVLTLSPFQFTSEVARLDLDGWVNLAGPIELGFVVATPRDGITIEGVGSNVLDVLSDDEGWVPIPVSVTGTLEDPKVRPDSKAFARAGWLGIETRSHRSGHRRASWLLSQEKLRLLLKASCPFSRQAYITLDEKCARARSARNLHAACDVTGAGNGLTVWLVRHSQRKRGAMDGPHLRSTAPALDPTASARLGFRSRPRWPTTLASLERLRFLRVGQLGEGLP